MKIKQGKAIPAMSAINSIGQKSMNSTTAYKLFRLKKALESVIEFQIEQEQKMIDDLGGSIIQNGVVHFDNEEQGAEFTIRRHELTEMECDIDIDKQDISMKEIPEISISWMESLEDFINWTE